MAFTTERNIYLIRSATRVGITHKATLLLGKLCNRKFPTFVALHIRNVLLQFSPKCCSTQLDTPFRPSGGSYIAPGTDDMPEPLPYDWFGLCNAHDKIHSL